jgi:DNA-binding HxlR family transcriptional regulator
LLRSTGARSPDPAPARLAGGSRHQHLPTAPTGTGRVGLDRLADRWSALPLLALEAGPLRFAELRSRTSGISEKMLTHTLRSLERDGLVNRDDHGIVPPRVEYTLTNPGRSLLEPLAAICAWNTQHNHDVTTARTRYDRADQPQSATALPSAEPATPDGQPSRQV